MERTIIIEQLKTLLKKIPPGKEWYDLSQKEASAMKNYNQGVLDAIKIIIETK